MNRNSKTLLVLCAFALLGTAHAGERIVSCEIPPGSETVNSLRKITIFGESNALIQRSFGKRTPTENRGVMHTSRVNGDSYFFGESRDATPVGAKNLTVTKEVYLQKDVARAGERPIWSFDELTRTKTGFSNCIVDEDYGCKETVTVKTTQIPTCSDSKDSEKPSRSHAQEYIDSDPCNSANWGK